MCAPLPGLSNKGCETRYQCMVVLEVEFNIHGKLCLLLRKPLNWEGLPGVYGVWVSSSTSVG